MAEYTIVLLLLVVVLIASPDVITQIIDALKDLYEAFTVAIGQTYPTPEGSIGRLDSLIIENFINS